MQTPVACFMTLETEEGKCRADLYNETVLMEDYAHYRTFLGSEIDVGGASEPTDIIWENRHFTTAARFTRTLIVSFVVFLLLCVSFFLIFIENFNSPALFGFTPWGGVLERLEALNLFLGINHFSGLKIIFYLNEI